MSETKPGYVVHPSPVWRERANFIVHAKLQDQDTSKQFEQLWVRKRGSNEFEICCIPFFLYDIALGDLIETRPGEGRQYIVNRVTEPSGRYVFRVWFGDSSFPSELVADDLDKMGALLEWSSRNLLAVDVENGDRAQDIANYLWNRERRGELVYESGRSAAA